MNANTSARADEILRHEYVKLSLVAKSLNVLSGLLLALSVAFYVYEHNSQPAAHTIFTLAIPTLGAAVCQTLGAATAKILEAYSVYFERTRSQST